MRMHPNPWAISLLCVVTLGCFETKVVNSDDPEGSGGSPSDGEPDGVDVAACRQCAERECRTDTAACEDTPGCTELIDCMFGCGTDTGCRVRCSTGSGGDDAPSIDATTAATLLTACAYVDCVDECVTVPGSGEGGAGGDGDPGNPLGGSGGSAGDSPQGGMPNAGRGGTGGVPNVGGAGGGGVPVVPGVNWLTFDGSRADATQSPNDSFGIDGVFYAYADGCSQITWDPETRCASGHVCLPDPPLYLNWGVAVGFDFRNTGETGTPPNTKFTWNPDAVGARGIAWQLRGAAVPAVQLWVLNMDPTWGGQCSADSCDIAGPPDGTPSPGPSGQLLFDNMIKDNWGGSGLFYVYDPAAVHAMQFKLPAIIAGGTSFDFCVERLGIVR